VVGKFLNIPASYYYAKSVKKIQQMQNGYYKQPIAKSADILIITIKIIIKITKE
jgi:hypothetical protein